MRALLFIAIVLLLTACDQKLWDGYSKTNSGLYYKIHKLGDGEIKAKAGDKVYCELSIWDQNNQLLYQNGMASGSVFDIQLGATNNATLSEAISLMHQGDSASFYFPKVIDIKKLSSGSLNNWNNDIRIDIKLNRLNYNLIKREQKPDLELAEMKQLKQYLEENNIDAKKHVQGVYLKTLKKGKGQRPKSGQVVTIHYSGKFINGKEFDNTKRYNQPLEFQLGKPDQVIKAIEIGLHHVNVGGSIRVISPSQYAFGEQGSSSGIIPPFTSVLYQIELLEVR